MVRGNLDFSVFGRFGIQHVLHQFFALPDVQLLFVYRLCRNALQFFGRKMQKRTRMSFGQRIVGNKHLYARRKPQKPQLVCHGGLAFAQLSCQFLLGDALVMYKALIALGNFKKCQVLSLEIFQECDKRRLFFVCFDDNRRHPHKPRHSRSPHSAFSRHNLIAVVHTSD